MAAPKRELFKAAEVCEVVQLQPYVLRSWEAEFPQIGQAAAGGGPRVYRRVDIELVLRIKQLVFDEGLTLSGARRRLEEDSGETNGATVLVDEMLGAGVREKLKTVKNGLQSILQMLVEGWRNRANCGWCRPGPLRRPRRSPSPKRRRRSKL